LGVLQINLKIKKKKIIQVNPSALADIRPMHENITMFQEYKVSKDKIKKENQLKEKKRSISLRLTFKTRYS
jgi:hypothetical protein